MTESEGDTAAVCREENLSDAKSKIAAAKRELEAAARWEEDAEQERVSRHHAKQLGIAIDAIDEEMEKR